MESSHEQGTSGRGKPNRLVSETSPYLQQHAHNPVDWYPWGDEAFERARREDRPILLSVGYSTCHWCHVMERESFEDPDTAAIMNEHFINIKVDREERPDVDTIYMNAVQIMTGHGGWPMTVFLTPEAEPFFAGTYFPPEPRYGMPGFKQLLFSISDVYRRRRDELNANIQEIVTEVRRVSAPSSGESPIDAEILDRVYETVAQYFDPREGGFGQAPKFPSAMTLIYLLRHYLRTREQEALEMVELSLTKMACGGIYDQLGGGFHRYSTDEKWLVPHFEKMLYDNALLSRLYLYAWQLTGSEFYRRVAEETLDYVTREMTDSKGGFYSAQDADSEGIEGKFFVWTPAEVKQVLGERDGDVFCGYFDVTRWGNWEGHSILNIPRSVDVVARLNHIPEDELKRIIHEGRERLFEHRELRIKPHRDEKVITSWNGMMLRAFAEAATILHRDDYRQTALKNAQFLVAHLCRNGRLLRTYRDGTSKLDAYLDDYALLIDGLLALYEATFDEHWLRTARDLTETMIERFWDDVDGGFFFTGRDHEQLIARTKDFQDNATPSGNSAAADVLLRLAVLLDGPGYRQKAERIFRINGRGIARFPSAFGYLLGGLDFLFSQPKEIAIVGPKDSGLTQALLGAIYHRYIPNKVVALKDPSDEAGDLIPLLQGRDMVDGKATAYVCRNFTCQMPVTDAGMLAQQLSDD